MNLEDVRAQGVSRTRKAWLTNPIRSLLWRLMVPYLQALDANFSRSLQDALGGLAESFQSKNDMESIIASVLLRNETDNDISAIVSGLQKDQMALSYRLASLEKNNIEDFDFSNIVEDRLGEISKEFHSNIATTEVNINHVIAKLENRIDSLVRSTALQSANRILVGREDLLIVETLNGFKVLLRQNDFIGRQIAEGGEWEPHVRSAIEDNARPDGIAIDVGAYIGLHTLSMSRRYGKVYSFEPQREIYQFLCANLALNGCKNVKAFNFPLYDTAVPMRIAPAEHQQTEVPQVAGTPHLGNAAALTFETTDKSGDYTMAQLLDDIGLEDVALIKIDAQGADLHVLRGARETIKRCRPTILFEWEQVLSSQHGNVLEDYMVFFRELDYEVSVLQETCPCLQADYIATPRPQ